MEETDNIDKIIIMNLIHYFQKRNSGNPNSSEGEKGGGGGGASKANPQFPSLEFEKVIFYFIFDYFPPFLSSPAHSI